MRRSRSSGLVRSAWTASARPPAAVISSHVSRSEPTYLGSGSSVRAVIATAAPSAANRMAIDFPSPLLPPVTSATFPSHAEAMSGNTTQMAAIELPSSELQRRLKPLEVRDIRRLAGGASSLTYKGRTAGGGRVVVKLAPAGIPPLLNRDVLRQARVLRALMPTGVPVPEVLWADPGDPPDVPPLFVMSFVDGSTLEPLYDLGGDDDP